MYNRNFRARQDVKVGDTIKIIMMADNDGQDWQAREYNGKEGVVQFIDGIGQLHGTLGGLAVIPEDDSFYVVKRKDE